MSSSLYFKIPLSTKNKRSHESTADLYTETIRSSPTGGNGFYMNLFELYNYCLSIIYNQYIKVLRDVNIYKDKNVTLMTEI